MGRERERFRQRDLESELLWSNLWPRRAARHRQHQHPDGDGSTDPDAHDSFNTDDDATTATATATVTTGDGFRDCHSSNDNDNDTSQLDSLHTSPGATGRWPVRAPFTQEQAGAPFTSQQAGAPFTSQQAGAPFIQVRLKEQEQEQGQGQRQIQGKEHEQEARLTALHHCLYGQGVLPFILSSEHDSIVTTGVASLCALASSALIPNSHGEFD